MARFTAAIENLLCAVDGILNQYTQPITVRQMFYRLVAAQLIENSGQQYARVSRVLTKARKIGRISADAFVDRTRRVYELSTWSGLRDFFETVRNAYRRDHWAAQPEYVEVWLEKEALGALFQPVCQEQRVPLCITKGRPSFSYMHETQRRLISRCVARPITLLYFGDFDPTGEAIPENIESEWLAPLRAEGISVCLVKVCLTPDQADKYPQAFCKESDPNTPRFVARYGDIAVELDAVPPDELEAMVKKVIMSHTNRRALVGSMRQEQDDLVKLDAVISKETY